MAEEDIRLDLLTKTELIEKFGPVNYLIFAAMLLVSALIGVFYYWRGQKNVEDFLLASRSMGTVPMTMSLIASFMSSVTLLGVPADMYTAGAQYMTCAVAYPLVMAAVVHFYLPVYDGLRVDTSYQYLELRFNKTVRILTTLLFSIQMMFYMAIVVYAPALALIQVTGVFNGVNYDVEFLCGIIFAVCIFYTCIGGIKAVIWTDMFQALIMVGSFVTIIIFGNNAVGGASVVFDRNYQNGRIELFNFNMDIRHRHTFWGTSIGTFFTWLGIYATNQAQVQRYFTVKKTSQVVTALWWNAAGLTGFLFLCGYGGMVAFAFYHDCDPIKSGQVSTKEQIFPLFVMQLMGDYPGIPGIFVAGVLSGALSSVSSGLNALAGVCLNDCLQLVSDIKLSEERRTLATRLLALIFGLISYSIVFLVKYVPGIIQGTIGLFGMIGGPILATFTLGMFFPFANSAGAITGMLSSLILTFWWGFGQTIAILENTYDRSAFTTQMNSTIQNCPQSWVGNMAESVTDSITEDSSFHHLGLYDVSYMWSGAFSSTFCLLLGIAVSLIKPQDHKLLDKRLISPGCTSVFTCWPRRIQDSRWWPKRIQDRILNYYQGVGSENEVKTVDKGDVNLAHINTNYEDKDVDSSLNIHFKSNDKLSLSV